MTADSDKWLEEMRRKLDQFGYPVRDVDAMIGQVAHYNAMSAGELTCCLHAIATVLIARGHGDIDIQRSREHLKAVKRGDVPEAEIRRWASEKEAALEKCYEESNLPWGPDEDAIKALLLQCLEHHYGTLDAVCVVLPGAAEVALAEIGAALKRYGAATPAA